MTEPHSHLEIALASIRVFTDDGRMDLGELERLLELALRDRVVDEDEKRVLANIFARAEKDGVEADVAARIAEVRRRHALPA
ncbi:hypothetical protein FKV24_007210 [Lysobacter maris]|uniref:TerB family tellurite resistance protein n=1 Tax=Marilutibacter maris TaxID=1605891 RepID=A0A508AWL0_9GAMM|nr:hypothetical protein [Lysobacter maris]KAB8192500.1 hypothetical protein FKV24_007210 [Lysobacter maris]